MKHVPIMADQLPLAYVHLFEDDELLEWGALRATLRALTGRTPL